jgi:hypothetical protein
MSGAGRLPAVLVPQLAALLEDAVDQLAVLGGVASTDSSSGANNLMVATVVGDEIGRCAAENDNLGMGIRGRPPRSILRSRIVAEQRELELEYDAVNQPPGPSLRGSRPPFSLSSLSLSLCDVGHSSWDTAQSFSRRTMRPALRQTTSDCGQLRSNSRCARAAVGVRLLGAVVWVEGWGFPPSRRALVAVAGLHCYPV